MGSQVAVAEVAVVPTFKGFRKVVAGEADGAAKTASTGFVRVFSKTGATTGKDVGTGFKKAFEQSSKGTGDRATKALEANIAKSSRALSQARLREQDAAGKTRVAEAQLAEARRKYEKDSSQVIRAEERLATASRQLKGAHEQTETATDDLKRAQGELASAADRAADELQDSGSRGVNGFRSNVVGGVKSFAGPLIAAFAALGIGNIVADAFSQAKDFVLGSVDFASDLNESVNAVQVAYGDAADAVLKLGDNSAKAFGLSKKDLNGYATQFSAFVRTIAGADGDISGTLQNLVGRGSDFASVFNIDVAEALQVFQSGLAGETEPLRKYGIDLSAAAVQAYALKNGIGAGRKELTEAEKQQARYGALMEQTSKVQGDFVNTSDQLANKNRINAAEWENVQAKIGGAFLPVAQQLATILGDDVLPVIADMAEEYGPELGQTFEDMLPQLTDLVDDLLPLLPGLFDSVAASLPPMIQFLTLAAPLLINLFDAGNHVVEWLSTMFGLLSGDTSLEETGAKLSALGDPLFNLAKWALETGIAVGEWFATMSQTVGTKVDEIIGFVSGLPQRALDGLGDLGSYLFGSGKALMQGFLDGIRDMFGPIGDAVEGALGWLGGFFPHSPAKRGPLSGAGWRAIKKSGAAYWEQFVGGMGDEGPDFPTPPGFPGAPGSGAGGAPATGAGGPGRSVHQTNHYDKTDPHEAADLATQQLNAMLRGA